MSNVVEEGLHGKSRVAITEGAPCFHGHPEHGSTEIHKNVWDVVGNIARARNGGDIDSVDNPSRVISQHRLANDTVLPGNQVSMLIQPRGEFVQIHGPIRVTL